MSSTYLSFVVTTRNDNHGGDLLKRTQTFLSGLITQTNKYKLNSELIIVEWNPPRDRPRLKDVLRIENNKFLEIRFIEVPNEIHQQYKYADTIPLFQMIAKNVGIRRAKGEFVLCTNIDILFSDELMDRIANNKLIKGHFYRCNRCDVPKEVMDFDTLEEQLIFSKKNIIQRHGRNPKFINITTDLPLWTFHIPFVALTLDFFAKWIKKIIWKKEVQILNQLDFMACGDFTLMSKQDWLDIDGYVEIDLYSLHVDSMALVSAKALGKNQVVFKKSECTYHIYHKDGWSGFDNPLDMIKFLIKRPSIDWYSIGHSAEYLIRKKTNWEINSKNWGFFKQNLKEDLVKAIK